MGSWNGTCLISQTSINSGDDVVGFILEDNVYQHQETRGHIPSCGGFCYSNELYKPMLVPFFGKYNDYGSIEEIESTKITKMLTKELGFESEEKLIDYCERDPETNSSGKYQLCMIHRELYEMLMEEHKGWIKQDFDRHLDKINRVKERGLNKKDEKMFLSLIDISNDYNKVPEKVNPSKDSPELRECFKILTLNSIMNNLRKLWMPQAGAGSQNDNVDDHLIICDFIGYLSEHNKTKWDEY